MQSRWSDADALAAVEVLGAAGASEALALRTYTTRLLGGDPALVLHGGGNTSLKTEMVDLLGETHPVLCVKGSGRDMATIDPDGLPAVKLEPLRKLRQRQDLSDADMLRVQRAYLLDPAAPSPSVEMLLHAFMPHAFVDHTHANAVLSLIDQPNGAELAREIYGTRLGFVPYRRPGFGLAKTAADVFDADRQVEGLILDKHGIFTFGATAREAYERMIEMVTLAEARLRRGRRPVFASAPLPAGHSRAGRGRADPARRLRLEGRPHRGRMAAADPRVPHQRFHPRVRQRQGGGALRARRRDHTRPHHPHQGLAADRTAAGRGQARGLQTRRHQGSAGVRRGLPRLLRAQQCPRRRRQDDARSGAARNPGARASASSASDAPRPTPASPPTWPRARCIRSRTPRRSANTARSARPTCSIASTGRRNRPSWRAPSSCRWPDRSWRSRVRAGRSARRRPAPSRRPGPRWRCSTSIAAQPRPRRARSARARWRSPAT